MEVIRKFKTNDKIIRMKLTFNSSSLHLLLIKDLEAFDRLIDSSYLNSQAKAVEVTEIQYYENLKCYMTDEDREDIKLNFVKCCFTLHQKKGSLQRKYFSVELNKCDFRSSFEMLIDDLNMKNIDLTLQLKTLNEHNKTLETEKELYKTKLEEFIALKENYDKKMMSNFVLVLNEKKKRIQYLNDLLDAFKAGREPRNPKLNHKSKTVNTNIREEVEPPKKQRLEQISESESDSYNTDEEKQQQNESNENEPVPSTSKAYYNILADDDSPPEKMVIEEVETNEIMEISTKATEINVEKQNVQNNAKNESQEDNTTVTTPEPLTLDFDTQDLLDRL